MPRRPPATAPDRLTPHRAVRLSAADWAALERIAVREGLSYGGQPSRSAAIRWLIEKDQK